MAKYGFKQGSRETVRYPVKAATAIVQGDMLALVAATVSGVVNTLCVFPVDGGDEIIGVAAESAEANATAGANEVLVYISADSTFTYPPDTGNVTTALRGMIVDAASAQAIDIDASTEGNVYVVDVDVPNNLVLCKFKVTDAYTEV